MQSIRKSFDGVEILHGVDFDLHAGEVHALIGENGAGKSTLVKVLAGIFPDHEGIIRVEGNEIKLHSPRAAVDAGIGIMYQELNLLNELSVAENMYLGREPRSAGMMVDFKEMNRRARVILERLRLDIDPAQPVGSLRIGLQQMVEIAKALSLNAKILIMDEPTSALTNKEVGHLFAVVKKLCGEGAGIIYISHHLDEIFSIAARTTVMRDGSSIATRLVGGTDQNELIKLMVGRPLVAWNVRTSNTKGKKVLQVSNLGLQQPDKKNHDMLADISFDIAEGEILGIAGLLGSGRTELLESLFGVHGARCGGSVAIEEKQVSIRTPIEAMRNGVALITEDRKRSGLIMGMSIRDNMSLVSLADILTWGMLSNALQRRRALDAIEKMFIRCRSEDQDVATLSGGNQQKVIVGKWLSTKPRILLLDEPTRGIDVGAKWDIYRLLDRLAASGCAILMASSELPELLNLCDRIMVLRQGRVATIFSRKDASQEKILQAATPVALQGVLA